MGLAKHSQEDVDKLQELAVEQTRIQIEAAKLLLSEAGYEADAASLFTVVRALSSNFSAMSTLFIGNGRGGADVGG